MSINPARGDGAAKVLYIGQSSRAIGGEIDRLKSLIPGCGPSSEYVSDENESSLRGNSSSSGGNTTRLMKCAHTLTEQTEFCSVCSRNAEVLQDVVLRGLLERTDSTGVSSKLCIVSDVYTQFSAWASSIAMEYLQQETSYGTSGTDLEPNCVGGLISVLVKPPMGRSTGLENLYALLATHYSLASADCTIFRGIETSTVPLATASTSSQSNGNFGIACDLFPILCSTNATTTSVVGCLPSRETSGATGYSTLASHLLNDTEGGDMQYHLWPFDICTSRSKIIDTRSSLAALLKRLLKTKSSGEGGSKASSTDYNPLRNLSSNLHYMHLAYCELYPEWSPQGRVFSSNYANLQLSGSAVRIGSGANAGGAGGVSSAGGAGSSRGSAGLVFADVTASEHELSVALNWATAPHVHWPYANSNASTSAGAGGERHGIAGVSSEGFADDPSVLFSDTKSDASGDTVRRRASKQGRSTVAHFPANAVNLGSRGESSMEGDDNMSVLSERTGNMNVAASRLGRNSGTGTGQGRPSSQISVMSTASRASVRSNNSRNMYAMTAAQSRNAGTSAMEEGSGKGHLISSVVFDSPYGKQDCRHICSSARQLVTIGAYRHLFGPAGSAFTSDQLMDAVEVVVPYYI